MENTFTIAMRSLKEKHCLKTKLYNAINRLLTSNLKNRVYRKQIIT